MKRLFFLICLALLVFSGYAEAIEQNYSLFLGTSEGSATSGNTTVASGTSTIIIQGTGVGTRADGRTVIAINEKTEGYGLIQISAVTASQAQQVADTSGVTFTLGYKAFLINGTLSTSELQPIFWKTAIGSSVTPLQKLFVIPPTNNIQFSIISGLPLDGFNASIKIGIKDIYDKVPAEVIGSQVFLINGSSGTSTPASDSNGEGIPPGTYYSELEASSVSGNSLFYTRDGKTFVKATAHTLNDGEGRALERNELDRLQMGANGVITVKIVHFNKTPE